MIQGQIEATNKSQSGKTIGVKVGETWYTTKSWELEGMTGQQISFDPSSSDFNGKTMWWINDYTRVEGGNPQTADQVMNQAMAQAPPLGAPAPQNYAPPSGEGMHPEPRNQPVQVNKDALIGALALTKSITGTHDQVWSAFVYFYHKMENFDPTVPF